jgi:hypothetical protein
VNQYELSALKGAFFGINYKREIRIVGRSKDGTNKMK